MTNEQRPTTNDEFMAIYLPSSAEEEQLALDELTPREIVVELDKHVIGQKDAKRAVAIALRNRTRRQKLTPDLAEEIIPKNIIMIGPTGVVIDGNTALAESSSRTREKLRQQLREGKLDERQVEIDVRERNFPTFEIMSNQGMEEMDINIKDMLPNIFGARTKKRKMKVNEAFEYLIQEEEQRLIGMDHVTRTAIDRVENSGIVFLDEIDKIAGREGGHGPDVSREGVQRDILPIVEGTTVNTRYGMVRTDHILFIAAASFHVSKT